MPLPNPSARTDLVPALALSYDSSGGNGPFGLGWRLSTDSVSRRTDRGLPLYHDDEESDIFTLSQAEDLVPALLMDGTRDAFDAQWHGRAHRVLRYRPRIESAFARIERWVDVQNRESHWRTITRENVTSFFGTSAASRIADPDDPTHVFTWLLDLRLDGKGNAMELTYKAEDATNIPTRLSEHNRVVGPNRYLKRVRYCNAAPYNPAQPPTPEGWLFEIILDYGDHDQAVPKVLEDIPWPSRLDPFSSYRAGFEVRTHRLCRRILVFHRFPELGPQPYLVSSTDLTYSQAPVASFLTSLVQRGYIRNQTGGYDVTDPATGAVVSPMSLPPLEMTYTEAVIDETVHRITLERAENLPAGAGGGGYQWIDLDGEGLPGVLLEQSDAWYYVRNVSQLPDSAGQVAARWEPAEVVARRPSFANPAGTQQLMDLAGDGHLSLVDFRPPLPGYTERDPDGGWSAFVPFTDSPSLEWADPNLRTIDLDGDGHADVLVNRDESLLWFRSLATAGFSGPREAAKPARETDGPLVAFAEEVQSTFLCDMTGDGLSDIVRIRNGSVCYWPNLGYGRFGRQVVMDAAPIFDTPERFDPRRLRLGDVDGSGTTDLVYLGQDVVSVWINQSGNSFSAVHGLSHCPATDALASVSLVDLLGAGTACLVWSSPLREDSGQPMAYIDLMGGQKPHLLVGLRNNMGAETRVHYSPSTRFYLEDRAAGQPWVTRLSFPVQVIDSVETLDLVSKSKLMTSYRYHHGYYDGPEREFRGFGMVERRDTESFSKFSGIGLFSQTPAVAGEEFHLPPVLTKSWYHNGAYLEGGAISRQYAHEYYAGDPAAPSLPDTVLPASLIAQERREACRALKGQLLRQEIYAEDGTPAAAHPYMVLEKAYLVRSVQPSAGQRHACFYVHEEQSLNLHYERNPADPRITHDVTLQVDPYGNLLQSAALAYARRPSPQRQSEQSVPLITLADSAFINVTDQADWYRLGVLSTKVTHELTGVTPDGLDGLFTPAGLRAVLAIAPEIPLDATPNMVSAQRRVVSATTSLYRRDDLVGALPPGQVESLALPWQTYRLALTPGLLTLAYGAHETAAGMAVMQAEGGYVSIDPTGSWWAPSPRDFYSPDPAAPDVAFAKQHFYRPQGSIDPFGNISRITYDPHVLLPVRSEDAVGNVVLGANDYRVLKPAQITDANDNVSAATFDALGMVTATALMGKGEGDTLADPTARFNYDLHSWHALGVPVSIHTLAREQHGAANPRWQETYTYSDGLGREVLTKIQAEPGLAPKRDGAGNVVRDGSGHILLAYTATRWVGTGRKVYDNKRNTVKAYEPFFDSSPAFVDDADLVELGVTPIRRYDPLSRLIRTDMPDGTFSITEFDAWDIIASDANDTVLESRWYSDRGSPNPLGPEPALADTRAAWLAAQHAHTPTLSSLDGLGRTFRTVADNAPFGKYTTRLQLDINGRRRAVTDPAGRTAATLDYDGLGRVVHSSSVDTADRWRLADCNGLPLYAWDSRGHRLRHLYDAARRPLEIQVTGVSSGVIVVERFVYGEAALGAKAQNLRTRMHVHHDTAGLVTNQAYDFKGNLTGSSRQLLHDYRATVDWSTAPAMDAEIFSRSTAYDALNRPTAITLPDATVVRPGYNEANLLETVSVSLQGGAATQFVTNLDYNARGQRTRMDRGNASGLITSTVHTYDPYTFRQSELATTRTSDNALVQDLTYTFDPVGNVTQVGDSAQQTLYFNNVAADPTARYVYDAIYRVTGGSGRERTGQVGGVAPEYDPFDSARIRLPTPSDGSKVIAYNETYSYDSVGNLLQVKHAGLSPWTRRYAYLTTDNRLRATSLPGDPVGGPYSATYSYDPHGSVIVMPHLAQMEWDFLDRFVSADLGGGGKTYNVYDFRGRRFRKVVDRLNGTRQHERISLDDFEVYREYAGDGAAVSLERQSVHIMDDTQRIALVETRTVGADGSPKQLTRHQYTNHLGSAMLELDGLGALISYEEYYPYGATSYQAVRNGLDHNPKRFRYTGKERDEETGLTYHEARFCAPWLGRWISCDPAGMVDGVNLYAYVTNNPITVRDPTGKQGDDEPARGLRDIRLVPDLRLGPPSDVSSSSGEPAATLVEPAEPRKRTAVDRGGRTGGSSVNLENLTLGNTAGGATEGTTSELTLGNSLNVPGGSNPTTAAGTVLLAGRFALWSGAEAGVMVGSGLYSYATPSPPQLLLGTIHLAIPGKDPLLGLFVQAGEQRDPATRKGTYAVGVNIAGTIYAGDNQIYPNLIVNAAGTGQVSNANVNNFTGLTALIGFSRNPGNGPNTFGGEAAGTLGLGQPTDPGSSSTRYSGTATLLGFYQRGFGWGAFGVAAGASIESGGGGWTAFIRIGIGADPPVSPPWASPSFGGRF